MQQLTRASPASIITPFSTRVPCHAIYACKLSHPSWRAMSASKAPIELRARRAEDIEHRQMRRCQPPMGSRSGLTQCADASSATKAAAS